MSEFSIYDAIAIAKAGKAAEKVEDIVTQGWVLKQIDEAINAAINDSWEGSY